MKEKGVIGGVPSSKGKADEKNRQLGARRSSKNSEVLNPKAKKGNVKGRGWVKRTAVRREIDARRLLGRSEPRKEKGVEKVQEGDFKEENPGRSPPKIGGREENNNGRER